MFQILKISSAYFEVKYFLGKGNKQYSQISQFRPKVKTRTKNYLSCASCGFFHFGSGKRAGPLFHKNVCLCEGGRREGERGRGGEKKRERERREIFCRSHLLCLWISLSCFVKCKAWTRSMRSPPDVHTVRHAIPWHTHRNPVSRGLREGQEAGVWQVPGRV